MITIGICDDENSARQHIKELCDGFFAEYSQPYKCIEFASGEEFLNYGADSIDLLFLDVELGGINGIEVKKIIEQKENVWRIIFVTNYQDVVWEAFGFRTLTFLRKPVNATELEGWLKVALKEMQKNISYGFPIDKGMSYVKLEDIYYFEAAGNYTYLYTKDGKLLVCENLKNCQDKMSGTPILRIHKSYLINMQNVKKWESEQVLLMNDARFSLGRQYKKEARNTYLEFVEDWAQRRG